MRSIQSLFFVFQLLFLLSSISVATSRSISEVDNSFFKSLEPGKDAFKNSIVELEDNLHKLFDHISSSSPKNQVDSRRSKHYIDQDGFDCYETVYSSSGILDDDLKNKKEEEANTHDNEIKETGGDNNLFRIQKRELKEDEKEKAPSFVVDDGFYADLAKDGDWFN